MRFKSNEGYVKGLTILTVSVCLHPCWRGYSLALFTFLNSIHLVKWLVQIDVPEDFADIFDVNSNNIESQRLVFS
jgi:hypothetical protein